jgi:hypothetical protein
MTKLCAVAAGMRPVVNGILQQGAVPIVVDLLTIGVPAYDSDSEAAQVGAGGFGLALSIRALIIAGIMGAPRWRIGARVRRRPGLPRDSGGGSR